MNLRPIGVARALRGLREGNQQILVTGLALILVERLRSGRGKRELIYRKRLPVGSALIIRHGRRGDPKVEVRRRPR